MKNTKFLTMGLAGAVAMMLMFTDTTFAATANGVVETAANSSGDVPNLIFAKFVEILRNLITYYIMFAGLLWVIILLVHGFSMLGKSDQRGKEEAKEKFFTSVKVGIFVIILPAIVTFLIGIVGGQIKDDKVFNGDALNNAILDLGQ